MTHQSLAIEDKEMKEKRYLEPHTCARCPGTLLLAAPKNYWPAAPDSQSQYRAGSICSHCVREIYNQTKKREKLRNLAISEHRSLERSRLSKLKRAPI